MKKAFLLTPALAACAIAVASSARAQVPAPFELPAFVVDVRPAFARLGRDDRLAPDSGLLVTEQPGRGWGIDLGAHWYGVRIRGVRIGIGGSLAAARGRRFTGIPVRGASRAHDVRTGFFAFSPQISINFAGSNGWSYLSGGYGTSTVTVTVDNAEPDPGRPAARSRTLNYGGGARWFIRPHLAFTFDIRFYAKSPLITESHGFVSPRLTFIVISAGIALK